MEAPAVKHKTSLQCNMVGKKCTIPVALVATLVDKISFIMSLDSLKDRLTADMQVSLHVEHFKTAADSVHAYLIIRDCANSRIKY